MSLSLNDFDFVRTTVLNASAIVLESDKHYLVETRLMGLARRENFPSISALVDKLRNNGDGTLKRKVIDAMTTNETSFFRDIHPFEVLRKHVIPEAISRRAGERHLRIWSAACSSGQEPYGIAMVLREHFPTLKDWRITLLATDLSSDILDKAREGRYSQLEVNRGLPAMLLVKYFRKQGSEWFVSDDLKKMIEFRQLNLVERWNNIPTMDIIFLRNVLIYFDVDTKKKILNQMRQHLRQDGYLFLGGAETTLNIDSQFERLDIERSNCYRQRKG